MSLAKIAKIAKEESERIFFSGIVDRSFLPWRSWRSWREISLRLYLRRRQRFNAGVPQSMTSQRSGMGAGMTLAKTAKIAKAGSRKKLDIRILNLGR
jgi:hypothetical protein